jgi:hypothetical protein
MGQEPADRRGDLLLPEELVSLPVLLGRQVTGSRYTTSMSASSWPVRASLWVPFSLA